MSNIEYYRVHLTKTFTVPVDAGANRDEVRQQALLELRMLAQDHWFEPTDVEIIEQEQWCDYCGIPEGEKHDDDCEAYA